MRLNTDHSSDTTIPTAMLDLLPHRSVGSPSQATATSPSPTKPKPENTDGKEPPTRLTNTPRGREYR